ncbi:leucine-rich repeat-containing protein 63 isoform X2 [Hemicordylus capensis]|uniref:leucine-rich repeat-containing protein 63 isoform X2 n=1 Tax=Hemicordylus capensis TaxID=884348 RepID=UPI002302EA79|nr:leucine-rich repeat-containing protein 63 isoform X2 [Hemicordylus capensis]
MSEPKLLRKPLPPKEEIELYMSKRKGREEYLGTMDEGLDSKEKPGADGIQLLVPVKSHPIDLSFPVCDFGSHTLGHIIMPNYQSFPNIKRDFDISPQPTGPPSFPKQKRSVPLRMQLSRLAGHPLNIATDFMLEGIAAAAVTSLHVRTVKPAPTKPVLSRLNYEVFTSQLIAKQKRGSQTASTVTFPPEDSPHLLNVVEPRKPERQRLIEKMLEEKNTLSSLVPHISEGAIEEGSQIVEERKQKKKKRVAYEEPDMDFGVSLVSGTGCTRFSAKDEEKILMTNAEMAVLCCLMHKKTGLSLKAFFLPQLPDLSPLADFLVYLNLSFNDLHDFPREVLNIRTLEILKLRNNPIKFIPRDIYKMKSLKVLIMSFNLLTALPSGLFELSNLEGLDVSYNELEFIPKEIGKLSFTACSCCQGFLYGEGLQFIRVYRSIYGLRLPYLFSACSPTCFTDFVSQTVPA